MPNRKTLVRINFRENGYAPDQIKTISVAELKAALEDFDDDDQVCLYNGSDCACYYSLNDYDLDSIDMPEDDDSADED